MIALLQFCFGLLIAGGLFCGIATAQPQEVKPKATGSISGHILINNKAAAGVDVGAFGGETTNRRVPAAITKTDSEGYFQLNGLGPGNYQLTTFMANLTNAEPGSDFPYGFMSLNSKGVLLAAGEQATEIDIKLVRGGVITGRITDAENRPVIEEQVFLEPINEPGRPGNRIMPSVGEMYRTDDRGIYRIYGLPSGRYRVSVGIDPARGMSGIGSPYGFYRRTYHPDATEPAKATLIDVSGGSEATNVDIRLGAREETFSIAGRIVDSETGLPVANAPIGLMMKRGQSMSTVSVGNQTAADGRFTVRGLTPGQYGVYVSSEYAEGDHYSDPVYVDIVDNNVTGVEIKALMGLSISGRIVADAMEVKELLKQLPGLRISVMSMPLDGRMTPSTIRSSGHDLIKPDGSFQINGLKPGRVGFSLDPRDPSKRPSIVKIMVGGIGVTQGFEIERGQTVSGIQVVVAYGTGAIRGAVQFQGGALPDGWRSTVMCRREGTPGSGGSASADSRGHFMITGMSPATYECRLEFLPYGGVAPFRPPRIEPQTVTVSNGSETELKYVVDLTPKEVRP